MSLAALRRRLALTVAVLYVLHFAPNVVRETYLAITLGERGSVRVDEYLGLHPDLFAIAGRGAYINSNPGASMLGALPYGAAQPALRLLFRLKPGLIAPKPQATYDDPRPNRARFMNEARARGLDVKLALAAVITHLGLMVPLAVVVTLVLFQFLVARLGRPREAALLALLYAFGTPIFFRSAFLNQNAILAHLTLLAFLVVAWPGEGARAGRAVRAGLLLGTGLVCDYSAAPLLLAFGLWIAVRGGQAAGVGGFVRDGLAFSLGVLGPTLLLLGYQQAAFGNPWLPAQRYMPDTQLSVNGWHGITLPTGDLLWRNLLDPAYGLFVFCPLLLLALAAPFVPTDSALLQRNELALIVGASLALLLFSSANNFAALQWNTGVRYMVPAGALLVLAAVPVWRRLPRAGRVLVVAPTLVISWAVSMMRESVPHSLALLVHGGPDLPWLITLRKTAAAYAPFLGEGTARVASLILLVTGTALWFLWRPVLRAPAPVTPT